MWDHCFDGESKKVPVTLWRTPTDVSSVASRMPRLDPGTYGSVASEATPLVKRGSGSWWDWRRSAVVALVAFFLVIFAVATRSRDYVPSVSPAALGDETFGRALVGVLTSEGLGVNYATIIDYECLARMTGRKLVLVPLVTEHFDYVPIDLAELLHIEGGALVPLSQAPDDILERAWDDYGDSEGSSSGWVQGGTFLATNSYFAQSRGPWATPERTEWQCGAGADSQPCVEDLASQVAARADDEIVTVFSDANFCSLANGGASQATLRPPEKIYEAWVAATKPYFQKGSGLSTLHWRRGDRCTAKDARFPGKRDPACADLDQTPVPEMCESHAHLYVATDDLDDDFHAALSKAGCLTFPQVFGDVGVTDAFGSLLLDLITMAKRTEKTFFIFGSSTENGMLSELMAAEGNPVKIKEITPEGPTPVAF